MEHIAPLIQTIFWVGLIGMIVWRFNKPLYNLLTALGERVQSGSTVKAGPFEISNQLQPQLPTQQAAKANSELLEEAIIVQQPTPTLTPQAKAQYFQAEDLALRAIQAEYSTTMNRQVTAGSDMGFDAAFVKNGQLHIVEVKFSSGRHALRQATMAINQLQSAIDRYGWKSVRFVIVVVVGDSAALETTRAALSHLSSVGPIPVDVRCYSLAGLQETFGLGA